MNRHEEALSLAESVMTDVELSRGSTDKLVLRAMRLARLMNDDEAQRWLGYEINGVPATNDGKRWMGNTNRWTNREDGKGYWGSAASLEAARTGAEAARAALAGDISLSGDYVRIAMSERSRSIAGYTVTATTMARILSAVDAHVYGYASDVYAELQFSEIQASLFQESQQAVDATFAVMAGSALKKIESINERLGNDDAEAISQAMSTCRRLIDAVADHVFPAADQPYNLNGQDLNVKQNAVLNRINAYLHDAGVTGGRASRLRRMLADIYERVSKAVHDDVDGHEARYLFLATYVTLGEVLTLSATQGR